MWGTEDARDTAMANFYKVTLEQFERMIGAGVFGDERLELLEGWIVRKVRSSPRHDYTVGLVWKAFRCCLPESVMVRIKSSITTLDSQPAPDLAVVWAREDFYATRHPTAQDCPLLVEVSDESLKQDRDDKRRIYARAGILSYWIANLPESQIEVYTQPRAGKSPTYRQQNVYRLDQSVPLILAGKEIAQLAVRDLLPPPTPSSA
jgi:Uma2 family endonuclease